jgi:tRNA-modifying protein YgfZ
VGDEDAVERLRTGRAFADLSGWRKVWVFGSDAFAWLNDLVTADLSDLGPGRARQALFLSPTGGLRAAFTVAWVEGGFLLLQDPHQLASIHDLLERYVLSSDVTLEDQTDRLVLLAFPGVAEVPQVAGVEGVTSWVPSCLGRGVDVLAPASLREALLPRVGDQFEPVGEEDVEAWRVAEGLPRFGVDALEGDLPQESGMSSAVSREKGCFPGQEAVAKVDRLGHPRRVVLALEAEGPASAGDAVMREGSPVGRVTSASANGVRTLLLARVEWEAREAGLHTASGAALRHRSA